jgi:hypothetical protein
LLFYGCNKSLDFCGTSNIPFEVKESPFRKAVASVFIFSRLLPITPISLAPFSYNPAMIALPMPLPLADQYLFVFKVHIHLFIGLDKARHNGKLFLR